MTDVWSQLQTAHVALVLAREQARLDRARADWWQRSALGTWAVNVVLSGVLAYLWWFRC
jgi:hypothetical protein